MRVSFCDQRFTLHGDQTEHSFELFNSDIEETVRFCSICSMGMAVVADTADGTRNLYIVDSFVHASPTCVSAAIPRVTAMLVLEKIVRVGAVVCRTTSFGGTVAAGG